MFKSRIEDTACSTKLGLATTDSVVECGGNRDSMAFDEKTAIDNGAMTTGHIDPLLWTGV